MQSEAATDCDFCERNFNEINRIKKMIQVIFDSYEKIN